MSKSKKYYHPQHTFFTNRNLPPPSTIAHGTDEDIQDKLVKLLPNTWHLEGNKLIGQTEMGPLVNYLPTDIICKGTDEDGMPILERIDI